MQSKTYAMYWADLTEKNKHIYCKVFLDNLIVNRRIIVRSKIKFISIKGQMF